jgi:hypothetical protein
MIIVGMHYLNLSVKSRKAHDYLRFGRISKEVHMDEKYIALRNLTRARFQAAQNLTREKTRFIVFSPIPWIPFILPLLALGFTIKSVCP